MMAKITKGSSFRGAVKYILDPKKQTELLAAYGVRLKDPNSIIRSFEAQRQLNTRILHPVGHISLDFSVQDHAKLDNDTMVAYAVEYMQRMGIKDTQFIIGRHHDKEHPHIHILYNRVDNNRRTISDQNDRLRSSRICKEMTQKYGLYKATGKENVKRDRLREPDITKYRIYDALVKHVPQSKSWKELQNRLRKEGIEIGFKTKGSTSQIEGVRFTANDISFNGSKIDRKFSYARIDFALQQNNLKEQRNPHHGQSTHAPDIFPFSIDGLFDIPNQPDGTDPAEEEFRRRMQRKKKKVKGINM